MKKLKKAIPKLSLNLTLVELKLTAFGMSSEDAHSLNLTLVELKHVSTRRDRFATDTLNLTLVELKLDWEYFE